MTISKVNGQTILSGGGTRVSVSSDVTITSAGFADITGLTFAVTSGVKYSFRAFILFKVSINSMGMRFGVNAPATTTLFVFGSQQTSDGGASTSMFTDNIVRAVDTPIFTAVGAPAADTLYLCILKGFIQPSDSGTFVLRMDKENVGGTGTVLAGSWLEYV